MSMLAEIEYNGELSLAAYLILAGMLVLLVGGYCWCFYRAIRAAGDGEEQVPDEE